MDAGDRSRDIMNATANSNYVPQTLAGILAQQAATPIKHLDPSAGKHATQRILAEQAANDAEVERRYEKRQSAARSSAVRALEREWKQIDLDQHFLERDRAKFANMSDNRKIGFLQDERKLQLRVERYESARANLQNDPEAAERKLSSKLGDHYLSRAEINAHKQAWAGGRSDSEPAATRRWPSEPTYPVESERPELSATEKEQQFYAKVAAVFALVVMGFAYHRGASMVWWGWLFVFLIGTAIGYGLLTNEKTRRKHSWLASPSWFTSAGPHRNRTTPRRVLPARRRRPK